MDGVLSVTIDRATAVASVLLDTSISSSRAVIISIRKLGFNAMKIHGANSAAQPETEGPDLAEERAAEAAFWMRQLVISLVFTIPVFLLAMVLPKVSTDLKEWLHTGTFGDHSPCSHEEHAAMAENSMNMDGLECIHAMPLGSLLSWILTTPVQFFVGSTFYRRAWAALMHCSTTMDTLVALGCVTRDSNSTDRPRCFA